MNAFEFGFFDELEKIATNKDEVKSAKKDIRFWDRRGYTKQYSKREIGDLATRMVQERMRSTSRLKPGTERRWDEAGNRIPPVHEVPGVGSNKGYGGYYAALSTPEAEKKFYERMARRENLGKKYQTYREHRQLYGMLPGAQMKPYGFVDRGFLYRY